MGDYFRIELPQGPRRTTAGDLALIGTGSGAWFAVFELGGNAFAGTRIAPSATNRSFAPHCLIGTADAFGKTARLRDSLHLSIAAITDLRAVIAIAEDYNMNDDTAQAVALLQARLSRFEHTNSWRAEQIEEALNILLALPDRCGSPPFLVRNALADSAKKLYRRALVQAKYAPTIEWMGEQATDKFDELVIETSNLICRHLSRSDQELLKLACGAGEAEVFTHTLNIPVARARERLSRARAHARAVRDAA